MARQTPTACGQQHLVLTLPRSPCEQAGLDLRLLTTGDSHLASWHR